MAKNFNFDRNTGEKIIVKGGRKDENRNQKAKVPHDCLFHSFGRKNKAATN